jgi:hypothetical protein
MFDISQPVVTLLGIGLTVNGSAALTAESDLTSSIAVVNFASSSLTAESNLVSDATNVKVASAAMSAESDLSSSAIVGLAAAASMSADSDLTAQLTNVLLAASSMSVQSDLVAGMQQTWSASASMSAEFDLTVTSKIIALAIALANGGSDLTANATRVQLSNALMSAEGSLVAALLIVAPVEARPIVFGSDLTATVYVPSKYLVLPTIELAYTDNVLLSRYPIDNGQALLITGTSGELLTFPAQEAIADADYYFRGGATNILDDESEAAVVAAGYGQYIVTQ